MRIEIYKIINISNIIKYYETIIFNKRILLSVEHQIFLDLIFGFQRFQAFRKELF